MVLRPALHTNPSRTRNFSKTPFKLEAPSPASSMLWLAGDIKEPTCLSQRVGHEVPGVVVWPLLLSESWGGECSEMLHKV